MIELYREQAQQEKVQQTIKKIEEEKILKENLESEKKIEHIRETKQQTRQDENKKILNKLVEQLQVKERKDNERQFDELIGKELGASKAEHHRNERSRQLLWQNAPELRQLRAQVLAAGVTRDRALQLAERRALTELSRRETLAERDGEEKRQREERNAAEEREREEAAERLRYHAALDEQRRRRLVKEAAEVEQARRERQAVDEIRLRIEEEDLQEERKKYEAQRELYRQSQELERARQSQRAAEKKVEALQTKRDDDYRRAADLRGVAEAERRRLATETRLHLQEELLRYLERMCAERERREALVVELAVEEREVAERERHEAEAQKRQQLEQDVRAVNDMLVWVKRQKEELARREEEEFRRREMKRLFEEEELELMSLQKRREKQIEHKRKVQEIMAERRRMAEEAEAAEKVEQKLRQEAEAERERAVERERLRFLRENAPQLLGYLPKGVLRSAEEAERLGEEFRRFYAPQENIE